jgi:hypothetical protein
MQAHVNRGLQWQILTLPPAMQPRGGMEQHKIGKNLTLLDLSAKCLNSAFYDKYRGS